MTISRFSWLVAVAGTLLALAGCQPEATSTEPIPKILASNLDRERLLDAFSDRLDYLADDKALMTRELTSAGFQFRTSQGDCGRWEYPVPNPADRHALRAFVTFCDHAQNRVRLMRMGIGRGPMTYD